MATKKPRNPSFTSPRGVFVYPNLNKPDFGTTEYPKPQGVYKTKLRLSDEVLQAWVEGELADVIARARQEAKEGFDKLPVATRKKLGELTWNDIGVPEYDKETEEPLGTSLVSCDMNASGVRADKSEWKQKPEFFDAKGNRVPVPPEIWGGSEGRLSVEAAPYFIPATGIGGVKLRLKAVKLLKVNSGGGKDAAGYGFGEEEDGFDSSEYVAPEGGASDTSDGEDYGHAGPGNAPPDF